MRLLQTFISILCLLECLGATDGFQSRQYAASNGLPNHTVRHMLQDSHGFVWMATLNGLIRYDGAGFTTFRSEPGDRPSLSDNRVTALTEDYDGYLWIETTSRIFSCYDLRRGEFVGYSDATPLPCNRIHIARNGDVWLSNTDGGAMRISHASGRSLKGKTFDAASRLLPADKANALFESQDGDILIGTPKGFARVKGDSVRFSKATDDIFFFFEVKGILYTVTSGGKVLRVKDTDVFPVGALPAGHAVTGVLPHGEDVTLLSDKGAWLLSLKTGQTTAHPELDIREGQVLTDNKGRGWIYNHTGRLAFFSKKDHRFKTLEVMPREMMARTDYERYRIAEDSDGTVWISTYGNGLFAYREDEESLRHFTAGKDGLIGSNSLRGMMLDSTGAIWLGTGQNGISTLWRDPYGTCHFLPAPDDPTDRVNSIRAIRSIDGESVLFASKEGSLFRWNPADDRVEKVREFPANVYAVLADAEASPLYGTRGSGLYVGDHGFRHVRGDASSLPDDNVYFIHRDRRKRVWVGTFGGGIALIEQDPEKGAVFRSFFSDVHGRSEQRCIVEDLDGRFWIGTSEGLLTFHPDSLISDPKRYATYSKVDGSLDCNEVHHLMRDSKGRLWIATGNDGIIQAAATSDGRLQVAAHYTAADGLTNNSAQAIVEDELGNIWISTHYGLSRLDPERKAFENFIFSHSPQENTYAEGCAVKLKDGSLLFGSMQGILRIDPGKYPSEKSAPLPLRFTALSINGSRYTPSHEDSPLQETIDYTDRIVLRPHQNSFSIDFAVMDFRDQNRYRYSYLLEGLDKEWSSPSPEGNASFSYVPAGGYTLKARCFDGARCVAEGSLEIEVKAPWWNTLWAWTAYALIIILITWIILRRKAGTHGSRVREQQSDTESGSESPAEVTVGTHGSCVREQLHSEADFLARLEKAAQENLSNPAFSVDDFASAMNLGRAVFYRKLKEVADTTPNEYLKKMRMQEAARLLRTAPDLNIAEIADRVGFSDSLYLSKCFKAEYGLSPSAYRKSR